MAMQQFVIEGGYPLNGTLEVGGNKNAVLKLMAACLLTDQPVTLTNVPSILDVRVMAEILRKLGASVAYAEAERRMTIHAERLHTHEVDAALAGRLRASLVLAGALLGRLGKVWLPLAGGDVIGRRRVDTHLLALSKLGAQIEVARGFRMYADQLTGASILLDEASVTATENAILAAARGHPQRGVRAACARFVQLLDDAGRADRRNWLESAHDSRRGALGRRHVSRGRGLHRSGELHRRGCHHRWRGADPKRRSTASRHD
jgi:UDP-N-acetylglucosamine 1-carboxyvinyltransferase